MFKVGQIVEHTETGIKGVVLGRSPKHWWPNLDDCYRVNVAGHGDFHWQESKIK